MTPSTRRIFILLDADGARRGFICDENPISTTIDGDAQPVGFGPGLEVATLPVRAASLMGETATDAGSISGTLQLNAFDLWAIRDRVPVQSVKVRAWLAPVNDAGVPCDSAGDAIALMAHYEIFRGVIRSPSWDLRGRRPDTSAGSLSFTAAADLRLLDTQFPPTVIDRTRFPSAPLTNDSTAVPIIYGSVFGVPLYAVSSVAADPVRLIVAGHPVVSTTIAVYRDGTNVVGAAPVLYDIDALGGPYAYVTVTLAQYAAGSSFYAQSLTGWKAPDGTSINRLGDVLLHLWHTYGNEKFFDIDRVRCYAAVAPLNRYTVAMTFNQQEAGSGLIRMLQGRLEGQFPVAFGLVGGRIGWDCTRLPNAAEIPGLVVGTLTYGLDAHDRAGPGEGDAGAIITKYESRCALSGEVGGTFVTTTRDRDNMGVLRGAVARWGESPMQRLDCPDMTDTTAVVDDLAVAQSQVRDSVTYLALDGAWNEAPLFGVVLVTDYECDWEAEPMLVTAVAPGLDGRVDLSLLRIRGA